MALAETIHEPVLKDEVVEYLRAQEGGMYLDCTLGGGGHTAAILAANPNTTVTAFDRDPEAIERAIQRFSSEIGKRLTIQQARFSEVGRYTQGVKFKGILADLGMSTDQLEGERGFSFRDKGALDMRMNPQDPRTASDILNSYDEGSLRRILQVGGVQREARSIAKAIIAGRPITTAKELAKIIQETGGARFGRDLMAVVFQALRIEVNHEFDEIEGLLNSAPKLAGSGTRLAVITFHSLEDKLVTSRFRKWAGADAAPAWVGKKDTDRLGKLLTKKAVTPSEGEVERNPASRSARLRVFEFELN